MSADRTQTQSEQAQQRALERSLDRAQPPTVTPGYRLSRFLGAGAYGEVWVGLDENTGRQVAVKFYAHRGGLDWSLLSREVEKLVYLSADRYVVQLLDVGWDANPPYYVMDYIENGSLDDLLHAEGPLPAPEALRLFREVAIALVHAHGKGVLHCDLKPANILLDNDRSPRLADFGQSRLSHEQAPALGTLFFMAPEQADLAAVPDARWDVYALGALLYTMLVGEPPHRRPAAVEKLDTAQSLTERLARYRELIVTAPRPDGHRQRRDVDRLLVDIIDRCLAANPKRRFANVQEVLDALDARDAARARRPLLALGVAGPLLLLAIMALFGLRGFDRALKDSDRAVTAKVRQSNDWAAQFAAEAASKQIGRYFRAAQQAASDPEFVALLAATVADDELAPLLVALRSSESNGALSDQRSMFRQHPARQALQQRMEELLADPEMPLAATWFVNDDHGVQVAMAHDGSASTATVGGNFAWRTYFHGGQYDLPDTTRVPAVRPLERPHLSALFTSRATNVWKVAVSAPVRQDGAVIGVVALTVDLGEFLRFPSRPDQFAVLVDGRPGPTQGAILQHPLFDELLARDRQLPQRLIEHRVSLDDLARRDGVHHDPLGDDPLGAAYRQEWIAALAPVELAPADRQHDVTSATGLYVIVQEDRAAAVAPVRNLGARLAREGLAALAVVGVVIGSLWYFVVRVLSERPAPRRGYAGGASLTPATSPTLETIALPPRATVPPGPPADSAPSS